MRHINEALERLKGKQQERAKEVLNELKIRGIKQIGKDRIQHLEMSDQELDYEGIMAYYSNLLKRDREAFELNKTKKINDVEIWTRAVKEEEKTAMETYCAEHGQVEIEAIQKAISDRHAKELATKVNLKTADGAYKSYMTSMMVVRKNMLTEAQKQYVSKMGEELKELLVKNAEQVYTKNQIKILNAQAEEKRRVQQLAKVAKAKAEGTYEEPTGEAGDDSAFSWGRGTKMGEAKANLAASEAMRTERMGTRPPRQQDAEDTGFARGNFTKRDAPMRSGGDMQRGGDDDGMMRRPMRQRDDGPADDVGFKKGGPPVFSRGGTNRKEPGSGMGGPGMGGPRAERTEGGQEDGGAGLGFRSGNAFRGNRGGDRGGRGGGRGGGDRGGMGGDRRGGRDGGARDGGRDNAESGGGQGFGNFRASNAARK